MACETRFESGENADVGVGVALALRPRTVIRGGTPQRDR